MGLLTETAAPAKEILDVDRIAVVADRGYFKIEDIEACEKAGMEPYVPRPHAVHRSGRACLERRVRIRRGTRYRSLPGWPAPAFRSVIGPGAVRRRSTMSTSRRAAIGPLRPRCTNNSFRSVSRIENEAVLDPMQCRLAQRPEVLAQRREAVEHPLGTIKQWMNQGAFLMRGLEKVRAEFNLTALA